MESLTSFHPMVKRMTPRETSAVVACTRSMSVLSLLGSCYIISTFLTFDFYRKPINRLVFFATWGNIMANIATLISTASLPDGDNSPFTALCELQAVLIQWFMMADALWVFCMAANVFLVFWRGYDAIQLRHLEKWYLLFAYGLTAIAPLIYIIMDHTRKDRVVGPATLWCWVGAKYDWMRIAFFYAPVWLVLSATMAIYISTGIKIVRKRALMRFFANESQQRSRHRESAVVEEVSDHSLAMAAGKNIIVTTQIQHDVHHPDDEPHCGSYESDQASLSSYSSTKNLSKTHREVTEGASSDQNRISRMSRDLKTTSEMQNASSQHDNRAKAGYRATVFATKPVEESATLPPRPTTQHRNSHVKKRAGNDAAMAYLKVAFLMFLALIVVWLPSSVNRLFQFINHDDPNYVLVLLSAIVLPLQGAWNATIYIYTTRAEFRRAYGITKAKLTGKAIPPYQRKETYRKNASTSSGGTQDSDPELQLEEGLMQGNHLRQNKPAVPNSIRYAG
jgi:hypothetical protein